MFYKPKFCCNCGEKIERAVTSFTDSGRFCDVCKHDFVLPRMLPKVFVALMAVFGIFGIGSSWRGGEKPLNVSTGQFAAKPPVTGKNPVNQPSQVSSNSNPAQTGNVQTNPAQKPNLTTKPPAKQPDPAPVVAGEAVYFCGAETKKGTPCSRRVKGGGRCWQHKGLNAMLPAEKLIASQ